MKRREFLKSMGLLAVAPGAVVATPPKRSLAITLQEKPLPPCTNPLCKGAWAWKPLNLAVDCPVPVRLWVCEKCCAYYIARRLDTNEVFEVIVPDPGVCCLSYNHYEFGVLKRIPDYANITHDFSHVLRLPDGYSADGA